MLITDQQSNLSVQETGTFSIEANSVLFGMLTKNVYNDVILAGIRELSTNAIDAHIEAGIPDTPFEVHLPTASEPTFSVRDFGSGLPEDKIISLFTVLGASTKRDSNAYNGAFGIGRMSPLAYGSSFTVESFHGGKHYNYLISIKDGAPVYLKLSEFDSSAPSGLKLSYAVQSKDIGAFIDRARELYQYFSLKPATNIELPSSAPTFEGDTWEFGRNNSYPKVLMANVIYKLNQSYRLPYGTVLKVPTGSVTITPGRESLVYDDKTTTFLSQFAKEALDDMKAVFAQQIYDKPDIISQAIAISTAYNGGGVLDTYKDLDTSLLLPKLTTYFNYSRGNILFSHSHFLVFEEYPNASKWNSQPWGNPHNVLNKPLIIQDIPTGFIAAYSAASKALNLTGSHLIIRPRSNTKTSIADMLSNISDFVTDLGFKTVVKLSDYVTETAKAASVKHASTYFQAKHVDGSNGGMIDTETNTNHYYYLKDLPTSNLSVYQTLSLRYLDRYIIVVPKKSHSVVESDPNFTLLTDEVITSIVASKALPIPSGDLRIARDFYSKYSYYVEHSDYHFDTWNGELHTLMNSTTPSPLSVTRDMLPYTVVTEEIPLPEHIPHPDVILERYPELPDFYRSGALPTYFELRDKLNAFNTPK